MQKLCLLDLDGTLVDPIEGITGSFSYALESFGTKVPDKYALAKYIGPPIRDSFREAGFAEAQIEEAVSKYREHFVKTGIFENTLYPGIIDMLEQLKNSGVIMAIATSKVASYAEIIAEHFGFEKHFILIAGSELDGTRSQKSEVITYALDILDPERKMSPVMIGDRKYDILGAREVGIDSIGVTWGYGSRQELESAGAVRLVDSPRELCEVLLNG